MNRVEYGRNWVISDWKDYNAAMQVLSENDFVAEMSDSYAVTCIEKAEVARQREQVVKQAIEKNLLSNGHVGKVWVVFYHEGKELARYTLKDSFPGELRETINLLAYEKGLPTTGIGYQIIREG